MPAAKNSEQHISNGSAEFEKGMSHGILKETQQKASQLTNENGNNATASCLYQSIAHNP